MRQLAPYARHKQHTARNRRPTQCESTNQSTDLGWPSAKSSATNLSDKDKVDCALVSRSGGVLRATATNRDSNSIIEPEVNWNIDPYRTTPHELVIDRWRFPPQLLQLTPVQCPLGYTDQY